MALRLKKRTAASVPLPAADTMTIFLNETGSMMVKDEAGNVAPLVGEQTPAYMNAIVLAFALLDELAPIPPTTEIFVSVYNPLRAGAPSFAGLSAMKTLVISESVITTLGDISDMEALEVLNVSMNEIESLPSLAANTALLAILVNDNRLTSLPSLTTNTDLRYLLADSNRLTALPDLSANTALEYISAAQNSITALPSLTGLVALVDLDVRTNSLAALPSLAGLVSLKRLYASGNAITTVPSFEDCVAIEEIDLRDNSLNEAAVDGVLADCLALAIAEDVEDVILDLRDNVAPGTGGASDAADLVNNHNWTVFTD